MSMRLTLPTARDRTLVSGGACEDRAVVPADIHDFFVASAGVAGALVGLLFVAILGLLFVTASLLSFVRLRQVRWSTARDALFLVFLAVTFVIQLVAGIDVMERPGDWGAVETIAILVIVCFLIGIFRAWDLIGGPSIGITHEVVALVRSGEAGTGSGGGSGSRGEAGGGAGSDSADDADSTGSAPPA
jgi:hypothetical protein